MSRHVNINGSLVHPLSLTPALWIDFSDAATVFNANVGGSTPSNGTGIGRVEDKSGNARHFIQATSGNRPNYQTGVYNGLSIARFDGTNDRLTLGSSGLFQNVAGGTIYAVRLWSSSPTAGRNILAISNNASISTRASIYGGSASGKSGSGGRRLDADAFAGVNGTNSVSTTLLQVDASVFDYSNDDLYLYMNGVQEASNTSFQTTGSTSNTASAAAAIGSMPAGTSQYFLGDIGEILVFHSAHSSTTRQRVRDYLRNKWAI